MSDSSSIRDLCRCGMRCVRIALVVGTILCVVNLGPRLLHPDAPVLLRAGANYMMPFIVSSLGYASSQREIRRIRTELDRSNEARR